MCCISIISQLVSGENIGNQFITDINFMCGGKIWQKKSLAH